ncbi:uncharacterized protein TRAVEDRAFT_42965 [Trametes versicolor FP-101664 SS1]|uniref:uncharacterized protein n=1 Tax=Trametes versicolor (strain FP-101664) TaxID=717944 RepID=UPI0004621656|nr:uncharacterized protein TRAVEDRAFT_42965 [Trametes versicolor FP-101664 SS1]EIW62616.1 hypothetical protein TRAVEDRAFT_42965 [Trametes versicolor FP-101664 SS1]
MDTLPLETLQHIFELACTDGGRTGNSLSLVSKGIRAAVRTTRFHSIALIASPRRLQSFIDLYRRECDPARGDRPRIQHMHVAFPYIDLEAIVHVVGGGRHVLAPGAHALARTLPECPSSKYFAKGHCQGGRPGRRRVRGCRVHICGEGAASRLATQCGATQYMDENAASCLELPL